jgi:prepilin-type N-terminal cleavage/methylation domain-containing protein
MNEKGFTLIEIVIVIVVLTIIGGFTMSFLISNSRTYQMMRVQRELYQDSVYMMERISRDITDARGTDASCANGFLRTHISRDSALCTQYTLTGKTLFRNGQPIGFNVSSYTQNFSSLPYTIAVTLERDCSSPDNVKCSITFNTSVFPENYCSNNSPNLSFAGFPSNPCNTSPALSYDGRSYNGDYEELVLN